MIFYDFEVHDTTGNLIRLREFEGKVLLIVNTATKCGFAPQFKELEELYTTYKDRGFVVLGFPCNQFMNQEPGESEDIQAICELNYGVTFPLFQKLKVNGPSAHPLFQHLKKKSSGLLGSAIKWNFTKFLVDSAGNVVGRYAPGVSPLSLKTHIEKLL